MGESMVERDYLTAMCRKYGVDEKKEKRLLCALDTIEESEETLELYRSWIRRLCDPKNRKDIDLCEDLRLDFDTEYPDCSKFLLLMSCVGPSEEDLIRRSIPKALYEDIPERMISLQLQKYQRTGSCEVEDFAWDKHFYTRAIYHFDRFYFIPCLFWDPFRLFRSRVTGETVGIYDGGYPVDAEGQLLGGTAADAANVEETAARGGQTHFVTQFEETEETVRGNYMNPCGFLSARQTELSKKEWEEVLRPGDGMLAFHIPSGEGYNPFHLKKSMQMALDFYTKYFPEVEIRGFWSESWLYDARLSLLLPESSNIIEMQRRFYNYSIGADGSMLKLEIWNDEQADIRAVRTETTLEKGAARAMLDGNRFCTTSMVVMREDVPKLQECRPYIREADLREFREVVVSRWKTEVRP